jgi:DNA-binding PadR family transcriptional regulator
MRMHHGAPGGREQFGHEFGRGFGPPRGSWGGGPGHRGGGRRRRGDIRTAILAVLAEGPGHGYDLMHRLEDKSDGAWRPSAGSVYPTLQQLEDEGLATSAETDGKRVYTITAEGAAEAARRIEEAGEPWATPGGGGVHPGLLFRSLGALAMAAKQTVAAGSQAQLAAAIRIVDDARRELYRVLADDGIAPDGDADGDDDPAVDPEG